MKPGLTIAALALALAAAPVGAGAAIRTDDFALLPLQSGFPPAGAGAFSPNSSPSRPSGPAWKPDAASAQHRSSPTQRELARADSQQDAALRVSYKDIAPDPQPQRAAETDSRALILAGLLGALAIARRRLLP